MQSGIRSIKRNALRLAVVGCVGMTLVGAGVAPAQAGQRNTVRKGSVQSAMRAAVRKVQIEALGEVLFSRPSAESNGAGSKAVRSVSARGESLSSGTTGASTAASRSSSARLAKSMTASDWAAVGPVDGEVTSAAPSTGTRTLSVTSSDASIGLVMPTNGSPVPNSQTADDPVAGSDEWLALQDSATQLLYEFGDTDSFLTGETWTDYAFRKNEAVPTLDELWAAKFTHVPTKAYLYAQQEGIHSPSTVMQGWYEIAPGIKVWDGPQGSIETPSGWNSFSPGDLMPNFYPDLPGGASDPRNNSYEALNSGWSWGDGGLTDPQGNFVPFDPGTDMWTMP